MLEDVTCWKEKVKPKHTITVIDQNSQLEPNIVMKKNTIMKMEG